MWGKKKKRCRGKDILYSCHVYLGAAPVKETGDVCTFRLRSLIINNAFASNGVRTWALRKPARTHCLWRRQMLMLLNQQHFSNQPALLGKRWWGLKRKKNFLLQNPQEKEEKQTNSISNKRFKKVVWFYETCDCFSLLPFFPLILWTKGNAPLQLPTGVSLVTSYDTQLELK